MIYFDEAGNTGDNLLDANQPTFTLASHDLRLEETNELLAPLLFIVKSNELHFKSLSRRPKYQKELIKLLNNKVLDKSRVFKYIVDKEFSVVAHIVDRLIEHVMYLNNIDLYQEGKNITTTNIIYILYKSVWKAEFKEICVLFIQWVRTKTSDACEVFYNAVSTFHDRMGKQKTIGQEFIGLIKMSYPFRKEIQNGFDETYTLDLTLSTFRVSCNFWGFKYENPEITMDVSKPITHFTTMIDMLKKADENIVGFGKREYQFKLKIGDIKLENSGKFPQIQLADILASSFNLCAREISKGSNLTSFAKDILDSYAFTNSSGEMIWPSEDVTPESIGMEGAVIGRNPLDHFVQEVNKQKLSNSI